MPRRNASITGVARVSAAPVTSARTNGLPTEAATGACAAVIDVVGARPAHAAISSTGSSSAERQRLRRGDRGAGDGARAVALDPHFDQAGDLLEQQHAVLVAPCVASTQPVPTLGWPANGISAVRLKMRTRAVCAGSSGGSTKVVSLRLNSAASDCICASRQAARVGEHGELVAAETPVGEYVDGDEGIGLHGRVLSLFYGRCMIYRVGRPSSSSVR